MYVSFDKLVNNYQSKGLQAIADVRCLGHVLNLATFSFLKWTFFRPTNSDKLDEEWNQVMASHTDQQDLYKKIKQLALTAQALAHGVNYHTYLKHTFAAIVAERNKRDGITTGPVRLLKNNTISTFKMLQSFNLKGVELNDEDWEYLSFVCSILETFEDATILLQSYKEITISFTIPYVSDILHELGNLERHEMSSENALLAEGIKAAKLKVLENYLERFGSIKHLCLASVLDPRLKLTWFEENNFSPQDILFIKRHVRNVFEQYKRIHSSLSEEPFNGEDAPAGRLNSGKIGGRHVRRRVDETSDSRDELAAYYYEKTADDEVSISSFYDPSNTEYPILSKMARDFLATPAMSSPVESLFSRVNDMVTKKRNRLLPTTIKILAILRHRNIIDAGIEDIFDDESDFQEEQKQKDVRQEDFTIIPVDDEEEEEREAENT